MDNVTKKPLKKLFLPRWGHTVKLTICNLLDCKRTSLDGAIREAWCV